MNSKKRLALWSTAAVLAASVFALAILPSHREEPADEPSTDELFSLWGERPDIPTLELGGFECRHDPQGPGLEMSQHRAYIHGSRGRFRPDDPLSRSEAAQIIYSLLEYEPVLTGKASFTDVPEDAWYTVPALTLAELGALPGSESGSFRPDAPITRQELVSALVWFSDGPEVVGEPPAFLDVPEGLAGYEAVTAAVSWGWISGYGDGRFYPNRPVTRAEAVSILNKALGRVPDAEFLETNGNVLLFPDVPFTHWAYADIMEATLEHEHTADSQAWASYTEPAVEDLSPGNYLIEGELYRLDGSHHWMRNKTVGVLAFDDAGRYTSGDEALDQALTAFVRENLPDGPASLEDYRRLYNILITFPYRAGSYLTEEYDDGQTGWEPGMALEMLEEGKGNCYRYAGLGAMLARKLGFQAWGIAGYVNIGDEFILHGWVEVRSNGRDFLCDPQQQYRFPEEDLFMKLYGELEGRIYRVGSATKK